MTRIRWFLLGSAALAALLILAIILAVPTLREHGIGPGAGRPTDVATDVPESETLFLPGYDDSPASFELSDPADATGDPITASLSLDDDAVRIGGTTGLSFDARELASPTWDSTDSNLTLTLSQLDRPALRFGGNGVDRQMWWTSSDEPAPEWAEVTVTPEDLDRVAAVAEEVDSLVTIDLDLGHDDPARAADMAAHAQDAFGDRLLAIAIGNEPNGFFHENQPQLTVRDDSWGPEQYQDSLQEYSTEIEQAVPGIPVAGPGAYDAPWWRAFAESEIPNQRALSMHWYPLWDCTGPASSIANPTVEDLTSPELRDRAREIVEMGRDVAGEHDLPLWMEETGPTSCPGTNETSRTHAQALWTVDYVMTFAESGVERTVFHSTLQACQGGAPMSPVCAAGELENPGLLVAGRTSYLALMQLGQLPDGQVLSPAVSGDGTVMIHAVLGEDGSLAIAIVDMRDPAEAGAVPVEISAPSGLPDDAPESWELVSGSRLSGEAREGHESELTALAEIGGEFAGSALCRAEPLSLTSEPGAVTLLQLDGEGESRSSSGEDDADPSDGGGQ